MFSNCKRVIGSQQACNVHSKISILTVVILAMVSFFHAKHLHAEIYKSIDLDGTVYYSDKPEPNTNAKPIGIEPADQSRYRDAVKLQQRLLDQAKEADIRIQQRKKQEIAGKEKKAEELALEQRCLAARNDLAILQEQLPVYFGENGNLHARSVYDTYQGNREYLDDARRTLEIEQAQNKIKQYCTNPDSVDEQKQARKQWITSEFCSVNRLELEALQHPDARASRQKIEETKKLIEKYCTQ